MKTKIFTSIRLDVELRQAVEETAKERGTQMSSIIRLALLEFFRREAALNDNNS